MSIAQLPVLDLAQYEDVIALRSYENKHDLLRSFLRRSWLQNDILAQTIRTDC